MSNTSYPFKENSNVMNVQGGEKKVMKKILSVALSTAMAFSMFASVAFGDTTLSTQAKYDALAAKGVFNGYPDGSAGLEREMTRAEFAKVLTKLLGLKEVTGVLSYTDKNYVAGKWMVPYVEAVTAAGLMEGKNTEKKIFDFNGNVTVEELAAILVRALDLEVPTTTDNTASVWAKGYVEAAIKAGFLNKDDNFQANAKRSLLVETAYAVDLIKNPIVTDATKVSSVSASNLKQVVVAFDGEVDSATAGDYDNYSISSVTSATYSTYAIKSATVADDNKSVTLTLADGVVFGNQDKYHLSFNNVKAGSAVLSTSKYEFAPVDASVPEVATVEALGNKTVRVTFSEPVKTAVAANFKVDGAAVVGYPTVSGNSVIIKFYSTLANGEHTLNVAGVTDFAGFKSLSKDVKFTVVEDTQAPTVTVEKASFEKVTLKFSEPVEPTTVLGSNVYWLQGTTKKYASTTVNQIDDTTFEFDFASNGNEIRYTTDLYVTNVQDYSGNVIAADTKVAVNPVVDQVRPEVINSEINDAGKVFTIKFSKALDTTTATDAANYVVKDADGKVVSNLKYPVLSPDKKTVTVTLAQALSQGKTYTLEISGVSDNTTLKNVLLPYTKQFTVGDNVGPKVNSTGYRVVTNGENKLVVTFDEVVAVSGDGSAVDAARYLLQKNDGTWVSLPSGYSINVTPDGKSVIINLPSSLSASDVKTIRVASVKDAAGNALQGLTADVAIEAAAAPTVASVTATANDTIKVKFSQTLLTGTASVNDYKVYTATATLSVISATVDGDTVILKLADNSKLSDNAQFGAADVKVDVNRNASTSTPAGIAVGTATQPVADGIAAKVASVTGTTYGLQITFNEELAAISDATVAATDLVIKDQNGNTVEYTVANNGTDAKILDVTFTKAQSGVLSVSISNPRFIKGKDGVVVTATSSAIEVEAK